MVELNIKNLREVLEAREKELDQRLETMLNDSKTSSEIINHQEIVNAFASNLIHLTRDAVVFNSIFNHTKLKINNKHIKEDYNLSIINLKLLLKMINEDIRSKEKTEENMVKLFQIQYNLVMMRDEDTFNTIRDTYIK